jgi:hypothetical protein
MDIAMYFFGFLVVAFGTGVGIASLNGHRFVGLWCGVATLIAATLGGGCWLHDYWSKAAPAAVKPSDANRARADILTYIARQKLLERFKAMPPKSVGIVKSLDSPEAREFGDVVQQLLIEAGSLSGDTSMRESSSNKNPPGRVVVQLIGPAGKQWADALVAALTEAGIPDVVFDPTRPPLVNGTPVQLTIKPK